MLFSHYFVPLCSVAFRMVQDSDVAKDIVQDVFVRLWENRDKLDIKTSLWGYLKRSVANASIDHTRRSYEKTKTPLAPTHDRAEDAATAEESMQAKDTQRLVDRAIGQLPDRCRLVFVLSRHEGLSYKQIAEKLGISPKTVENQMTKALKMLRVALKPVLVASLGAILSLSAYLLLNSFQDLI